MADAIAPALLIAYAVGRMGCQVSGDGDWGIYNSAYISDAPGHVIEATSAEFEKKLNENKFLILEYSRKIKIIFEIILIIKMLFEYILNKNSK